MARKSRKNTPIAVAEPTDNLTTKAVLSLDKEAKPYQVGIYARLSFESEANKERDTVDTQIAYIREFINGQDDMVEVCVYADISVTGTTFERPEFDRMIHDIRAGKINTVITRDLAIEILERGKVPFYCCAWSNIKSARNAIKSGFRPAWAQMTVKPLEMINEMNGIK